MTDREIIEWVAVAYRGKALPGVSEAGVWAALARQGFAMGSDEDAYVAAPVWAREWLGRHRLSE